MTETSGPVTETSQGAAPEQAPDLSNKQYVGRNGYGEISIAFPRARMTCHEALVHAAWIVLLAGDDDGEFAGILAAVRGAS